MEQGGEPAASGDAAVDMIRAADSHHSLHSYADPQQTQNAYLMAPSVLNQNSSFLLPTQMPMLYGFPPAAASPAFVPAPVSTPPVSSGKGKGFAERSFMDWLDRTYQGGRVICVGNSSSTWTFWETCLFLNLIQMSNRLQLAVHNCVGWCQGASVGAITADLCPLSLMMRKTHPYRECNAISKDKQEVHYGADCFNAGQIR